MHDEEQGAAEAIAKGAYDEALRLLTPLAEHNSEYALLTIGWIYETGAVGAPDKNAARLYYEGAADRGSVLAYFYLGWLLYNGGQEAEGRAAFERGAALNNEECRAALTRIADNANELLAGRAIEDGAYDEAVRLLRPLAERNSEYALLTLGWIYETGATGPPDKEAARSCYEQAVAQGSPAAHLKLGRLLLKEGEETQARATFEEGAKDGNVPCMARLGKMMVEGRGGPTDLHAGIEWLERAAAEGHIFGQRTLLAIEERNAKSLLEKLSIKKRIAALVAKGAKEMLKDPGSDKLR